MTKLSFINTHSDDRRVTIKRLDSAGELTPLASQLNEYTICPSQVGFCLGPYVAPIVLPTIELVNPAKFEGYIGDRLDIALASNYEVLPTGYSIIANFSAIGDEDITGQFSYDTESPLLLQGIELTYAALDTTFSVSFSLVNKTGKVIQTTASKEFTILTGRARIQYTAPTKITEGNENITVAGRINLGKRNQPVKFTFTDTTDPSANKKVEFDAPVNGAGEFNFKIDLSSFLDGNIFISSNGVDVDNAVVTGPYQIIDNFFPLVIKVLGGRNLRVATASGTLNIPSRLTWGDNRAGPLANGHMVHTYTTTTSTVHELNIRRNTGPLVVLELAECTLDASYSPIETTGITEIVNFGKAVLGIKLYKATTFSKVPAFLPDHMTKLDDMFNGAKVFNDINMANWKPKNVTTANRMLKGTAYNQNLSKWCVSGLKTEPTEFSSGAPLTVANKPVWGTCPIV